MIFFWYGCGFILFVCTARWKRDAFLMDMVWVIELLTTHILKYWLHARWTFTLPPLDISNPLCQRNDSTCLIFGSCKPEISGFRNYTYSIQICSCLALSPSSYAQYVHQISPFSILNSPVSIRNYMWFAFAESFTLTDFFRPCTVVRLVRFFVWEESKATPESGPKCELTKLNRSPCGP